MIKFFRHIRRNLMASPSEASAKGGNKTGKYLKYAIGEIILVVIGILIALQINNWNQNRIETNEELNILKALKVGLKTDLADLNLNAIRINSSIASANTVIKSLENDEPYRDSIADHFGIMMFPQKFLYSTSAFETLKSKGIGLVKNPQLRDAIVGVYDSGYNFFVDNEKTIILDEVNRGLTGIFSSRFEESFLVNFSKANYEPQLVPLNFDALKTDQEFLYYVKSYRNRLDVFLNFHYKKRIIILVENLINMLDEEIKILEN